jgi:hypothetical protein
LVLHFHKLGYFYLPEGRKLAHKISVYANKGRYSTNPNRTMLPSSFPSLSEINKVLDLRLPVTLEAEMLHTDLAKAFARVLKQQTI